MKLINIGFGNLVSDQKIAAITSPESAPIKRVISEAKERKMLIDASFGRPTKAVIICDSNHVILSSLTPDIINKRLEEEKE